MNIVKILEKYSIEKNDSPVFSYLKRGESIEKTLSFSELQNLTVDLSEKIITMAKKGDRAVLLFDTSLEFIITFYSCLRVGVIPVPLSVSNKDSHVKNYSQIIKDCKPKIIICDHKNIKLGALIKTSFKSVKLLDYLNKEIWSSELDIISQSVELDGDDIAFIQYTSGSTNLPKGVCITHKNLLSNSNMIEKTFGHNHDTKMLSWLPHYHDMGLVGSFIQPVFSGFHCLFMSPLSFVQRPLRWLEMVSEHNITSSGGPNFSYELVARSLSKLNKPINLESWEVAFNGAEPINLDVIDSLKHDLKRYGFKETSFLPCYGMAEATLFISGKLHSEECKVTSPKFCEDLKLNNDRYISVGRITSGSKVIIEDQSNDNSVGEILISGENIFKCYWNKENENDSFKFLNGERFFRTGDLGFINDGELYITGRKKEIIIQNGRNIYPSDIEIEIRNNFCFMKNNALFSDDENKIILYQELDKLEEGDFSEYRNKIESLAFDNFGVLISEIVFKKRNTIPKTTSGKVKRLSCKENYIQEKRTIG